MTIARHAPASARGFTLIELLVVVAIVGILALGVVPLGELAAQRTREQDLRVALRQIRTAIDARNPGRRASRMSAPVGHGITRLPAPVAPSSRPDPA